MRRIKALSDLLANQIAAGEVVERPASVVKELVENSIDAGATEITIELEEGGKSLIRIKDNGNGIVKDDLPLALSAHATSKIYELSELEAVETMGFRGEALASIASVSKLSLISRHIDSDMAWEVVQHGKEKDSFDFKPAAYPVGTSVEVKELFFNTPARRKFLKTDKTEYSHIEELIKRFALCHFHIQFTLIHNGKTTKKLPIADTMELQLQRISQLGRKEFLSRSIQIDQSNHNMRLWGWVGEPEIAKATADMQYFYINGRMIRDKVITHAIKKAYADVLYNGRYPVYVLYLGIEHNQLDVNVHPTKSEVRFHNSQKVHGFIYSTIEKALANTTPLLETVQKLDEPVKTESSSTATYQNYMPEKEYVASVDKQIDYYKDLTEKKEHSAQNNQDLDPIGKLFDFKEEPAETLAFKDDDISSILTSSTLNDSAPMINEAVQTDTLFEKDEDYPLGFAIAQLHGIYILAENKKGLILVDMHAAHERILYEGAKESWQNDQMTKTQELLIPITVSLSHEQLVAFEEYKDILTQLGIQASLLGESEIVIRRIPVFVETNDLESLVIQLLTDFKLLGFSDQLEAYFNQFLATLSCHSALRANDQITNESMNEILRQMEKTARSNQCNHGRPTWVQLDFKDLDKFFMRGR